jgi:histidinol phosphatase-like PHP family hydrolase
MIGELAYDAHVHTALGQGLDPPAACVRAAEAFGLQAIALTDHYDGEESQIAPRLEAYAQAAAGNCVQVIPGASCDILDPQGRLTLSAPGARPFGLVLAGLSPLTEGVARATPVRLEVLLDNLFSALENACRKPFVNVLAAPFALGRFAAALTPDQIPEPRLERLAEVMREAEVAFELSNGLWDAYPEMPLGEFIEQYARLMMAFSRGGVKFIVGSGARSAGAIGHYRFASRLAAAASLERSQLVDLTRVRLRR